jgi:hypothetical protein
MFRIEQLGFAASFGAEPVGCDTKLCDQVAADCGSALFGELLVEVNASLRVGVSAKYRVDIDSSQRVIYHRSMAASGTRKASLSSCSDNAVGEHPTETHNFSI